MLFSSNGASGVKVHGGELFATRWASTNSIRNDCKTIYPGDSGKRP